MPAPDSREPDPEHRVHADHEISDVNVGAILKFGLGSLVFILLAIALVTGIEVAATGRWPDLQPVTAGLADHPEVPLPSEPRLESRPGQTLQELRANEQALLHSYGWVDEPTGVVRIPIERAMELLVQRGLPARPGTEGARFRDQGQAFPSDSSSGQRMEERSP